MMELYLYRLDDSKNKGNKEDSTYIFSRIKIIDGMLLKTYNMGNKSEGLIKNILTTTNRRLVDKSLDDKVSIVLADGILFGYGVLKNRVL